MSVALGDVTSRPKTWNPSNGSAKTFTYVDLSSVDQSEKVILSPAIVDSGSAPSRARQLVRSGDILVSTVRPNLNAVAEVPLSLDGATCSTGFTVLRPDFQKLDGRYLFNWVRSPPFIDEMISQATGASYPAVSDRIVRESPVPLPPLAEQRRIAGILDQADTLRTKRREAISLLGSLADAEFKSQVRDGEYTLGTLEQAGAVSFRNGVSPSTAGSIEAKVLTLSAITRGAFNPGAWKAANFATMPQESKRVRRSDLLICRGNGNLRLVGRGHFPVQGDPDLVFPDTMIAVEFGEEVDRAFVEHTWNSTFVRRQIESLARTTNGTYKVNQEMLAGVEFPVPPKSVQRLFSVRAEHLESLTVRHRAHLAELDTLFASLQHRAFSGEL